MFDNSKNLFSKTNLFLEHYLGGKLSDFEFYKEEQTINS